MANFSDLPRELRDMIYEWYILIAINDHRKARPGTIRLITAAPLLLANRQVGVEFAEVRIKQSRSPYGHADT